MKIVVYNIIAVCFSTLFISSYVNAQILDECCDGAGVGTNGAELINWGNFECLPVSANAATIEASCGSNQIDIDPGFGVQTGCAQDNFFSVINPQLTTNCYAGGSDFSEPIIDPNGNVIGPGNRALFVNGGDSDEIFCFDIPTIACRSYCFSAYVYTDCCGNDAIGDDDFPNDVNDGNPSAVGFSADGVIINQPVQVAPNTGWNGFAATFAGTGANVRLCVIDAEPAGGGNDWVLDNVSTYPIDVTPEISPIADIEFCASSETVEVDISACSANAVPFTVTVTSDNANVNTNSPIIVNDINDFPVDLIVTGNTVGSSTLTVDVTDNNGCTAEDISFNVNFLGRPVDIVCPPDYTIQCDSDLTPSFINATQFLDAGGSIIDGCGTVEFQCVNERIE